MAKFKDLTIRFYTSLILIILLGTTYTLLHPIVFSTLLFTILCIIVSTEWPQLFKITDVSFWAIVPFYPILPFALLIYLNEHPLYHHLLVPLFLGVASFDTGSYLIGSLLGKYQFIPTISPHKTVEGVIGGYCFSLVLIFMLRYYAFYHGSYLFLCMLTLILCICALVGDPFESWLKRRAHIKNTGNILPGHGGFLDRFDGILFVAVFFFLFRDYLINRLG